MLDVQDKVVAITGAARGLGQEFAASLAAAGGRIVAGDINDCAETLDLVRKAGNVGVGVKLDVTDPGSARDMVEAAMRAFGRLDALINNAALYGALHGGRFDAIEEAEWDAAMAVNVKGIWNCCKAAVPAMRQSIAQGVGSGSIVNIASLARPTAFPSGLITRTWRPPVLGLSAALAGGSGADATGATRWRPAAALPEGPPG